MNRPSPLTKVGFVGGGQLARMSIYRAAKLGFHFTVLDPDPAAGATTLADRVIAGSLYDRDALTKLVTSCEVTTYDIEHCDTVVLGELEARGHRIIPSPRLLQTVQDKVLQKQKYLDAGLPVAPFVDRAFDDLGNEDFPLVQKARTGGYDGRGVAVLKGPHDRDRLLPGDPATRTGSYFEEAIPFVAELGVMVARGTSGQTVVYPATQMVFDPHLHLCTEVLAPAPVSDAVARSAQELAVRVVEALDGVGVFGVELFLLADGSLVVNETAPRPHNSGHYTMEACLTCQFENHLRAVCGLPLGDATLVRPAVMVNLLGVDDGPAEVRHLDEALAESGFSLHLYGKAQSRRGRKMGHFTVTSTTLDSALDSARRIAQTLRVGGRSHA